MSAAVSSLFGSQPRKGKQIKVGLVLVLLGIVSAFVMTEMFQLLEPNVSNTLGEDVPPPAPVQDLVPQPVPQQQKKEIVTVTVTLGGGPSA